MKDDEFRAFVARLGESLGATLVDEGSALGLEMDLDEGRHQRVFVGLANDAAGTPLLVLYTVVGEAADVDPVAALELNATIPYGSVAVLDGKVIMRRTERLAQVSAAALADSVRLFALNADVIEEAVYGRSDRF